MRSLALLLVCTSFSRCAAARNEQPFWGCGLMGDLPGIDDDGSIRGDTRILIDGLKSTNRKDGKVTYWNWNLAPEKSQRLTEDFVFVPNNWGVGPIPPNESCGGNECLREAGESPFLDGNGAPCPATMGDVLIGANEPDIYGSCMGTMMGLCTAPCTAEEVDRDDCPVAHLEASENATSMPNSLGHCDCWSDSHATGVGFWNIADVSSPYQPLPTCWENKGCIDYVMKNWKRVASKAAERGYQYLSAPMVAVSVDWMREFVAHACHSGCTEVACGCPSHVAFHYYANDCQPDAGGYDQLQAKLDATTTLMEDFPHLQGAIINEVGMLNCAMDTPDAICAPNGPDQRYPADRQPNHACPSTTELPNGLASFVEKVFRMVGNQRTSDGRQTVVGFTWFNMNMEGGTYNLRLFDDRGNLNDLGRQYVESCQVWANGTSEGTMGPPTLPHHLRGATNSILLTAGLVVISSLLSFLLGVCFGLKCAAREQSSREEKERGQYEMVIVNERSEDFKSH